LKDKFATLFEDPAAGAGGAPPDDDERDQALGMLNELANRARSTMLQAAGSLGDQDPASAVDHQHDALEALNEVYMALAPFSNVVQRSLAVQEPLITASEDLVSRAESAGENSEEQGMLEDGAQADYDELARLQGLIQQWAQVLPLKAEQQLEQQAPADTESEQDAGQTQTRGEPTVQQIEALGQAAEKAIELAPQIETAAGQAADALAEQDAAAALPDEQEVQRLLKEIADLLPRQDQQSEQQGDQQGDQQEQQEQQPSEQRKEKKRDESEQGDEQQPRPQESVDRSQAEALLRRVRERERERREREKQLQRYLRGGIQVDKDW
jgi:hypothetical protein